MRLISMIPAISVFSARGAIKLVDKGICFCETNTLARACANTLGFGCGIIIAVAICGGF